MFLKIDFLPNYKQNYTIILAFLRLKMSGNNKKYHRLKKVEAELTRLRANGNNAPREELLALLIGRDLSLLRSVVVSMEMNCIPMVLLVIMLLA